MLKSKQIIFASIINQRLLVHVAVITRGLFLYLSFVYLQGDKFKRPHAERGELMRNMSNVSDGPEQVMEADEYLNPNRVADDSIASSAAASTSQQLTIPRNGSMSSHSRVRRVPILGICNLSMVILVTICADFIALDACIKIVCSIQLTGV